MLALPFSCRKMRYSKLLGSPCMQDIASYVGLIQCFSGGLH